MLTEIRDRATGWFAAVIAALIIIPMAFWGIGDYAPEGADPVIIEIGEQKITQQMYQQQLSSAQTEALRANPSLANSDIFSGELFKRQVLDRLIDDALTRDIANQQKYMVGDDELAATLRKNELFQTDGEFNPEAYENFALSRSASKTQFENGVRENARSNHVRLGYNESALVLPDELNELLEIQVEKRGFDVITINQSDYVDSVTVTDADINDFYKENINDYMESDRVSVSYVSLDIETLSKEVELNPSDVQALYDDNQARYRLAESREVSHILLSDGSDSEQLEKAQSLIEQLKGDASFAELAKEHSKDPGSANNGGSLGEIDPGAMVPEFDQAAFSLEKGVVSEPIKTQFGYHILKVDNITGGTLKPFDEVKDEIETSERQRLAQDIMSQRVELLRNLVFEQPESLEGVASELDLKVQTTDLFARDEAGQGILQNDNIRNAAFSEQVLTEGYNSEPIEVAGGGYVALRKLEFRESEPKALKEVSETIKSLLVNQRASDAAEKAGDSILATAKNDWSSLADDEDTKIESHTVSMVERQRPVSDDILRQVFKTRLDGAKEKVISFTDQIGNFNIVRLKSVVAGDVSKVDEQIKESIRRVLAQRNGSALFNSYLNGLTKDLESKINQDLL